MKEIKPIHSPAVPPTKRDVQLFFRWLVDSQAQPRQLQKLIEKYKRIFVKASTREDVLAILRTGRLQKSNLAFIARKFQLTDRQAAVVADVSERTYRQWEGTHLLSSKTSEHLLRIAEVYRSGMQLYDNNERSFITWMNLEIPALRHRVPVNMMISSWEGANTINNLLCCMEYGILV